MENKKVIEVLNLVLSQLEVLIKADTKQKETLIYTAGMVTALGKYLEDEAPEGEKKYTIKVV